MKYWQVRKLSAQPGVTAPSRSVSGGEGKVAERLHPGGLGAGCPQSLTSPIRRHHFHQTPLDLTGLDLLSYHLPFSLPEQAIKTASAQCLRSRNHPGVL